MLLQVTHAKNSKENTAGKRYFASALNVHCKSLLRGACHGIVLGCVGLYLGCAQNGRIKTLLKIPSYFKDWRFIHQQPFKSFKSSKSFYGPCRHVGLKGLLTVCSSQTGLAGPGFSGVWHYVDVPSIVCPGGPGHMDGGLRRMS